MSVKARLVIPGLADGGDLDPDLDDIPGRPRRGPRGPRGPRTNVVFRVGGAGTAAATSGRDGRVRLLIDTRNAERQLLAGVEQLPGATGEIVEYRTVVQVRQPSGAKLAHADRRATSPNSSFALRIPRRRVVVLDMDGLRWDVLYRHLKRVRDAGADLDRTYRFEPRPDATRDTVIGEGKDLRSGLGELCFGDHGRMVDVRLGRAPYPSFTFPSHATMFTGVWPRRHGIAGNQYYVRDGSGGLNARLWEKPPRAPSLHGFCTSSSSTAGIVADYLAGGFDVADEDDCPDRNRGLVSDLLTPTVYDLVHRAGRRSCSIHGFFHGALQPWTSTGRDQWWHLTNPELGTIKDACSDEDADQYEPFDSASFVKAHLLLRFRPSTVRARDLTGSGRLVPMRAVRADRYANTLGGTIATSLFRGAAARQGPPDLISIYVASIDKASHIAGSANQDTYLAWHDNRLAAFLDDFRQLHAFELNNAVFVLVADHGHQDILPSDGISQEVLRSLAALAAAPGEPDEDALDDLVDLLEGHVETVGQAMNQYVYLGPPGDLPAPLGVLPDPETVARHLLETPLSVTPYAALVRVGPDQPYRLLARGDDATVALDSTRARDVVTGELELPALDEAEIRETSARPVGADAERALRRRLSTDGYDVLHIERLLEGFAPGDRGPADRMPDVILLAGAHEAFSNQAATHGSVGYPLLRIPILLCGPALRANEEIAEADMVDVAPTILSLLGIEPEVDFDGQALVDFFGRPRLRGQGPLVSRPPIATKTPVAATTPRIRTTLHIATVEEVPIERLPDDVPTWIGMRVVAGADRREVRMGATRLHRIAQAELKVVGGTRDGARAISRESEHGVTEAVSRIALAFDAGEADRDSGLVEPVRLRTATDVVTTEVPRMLALLELELRLPHVPAWLFDAIRDAAQTDTLLVGDRADDSDLDIRADDFLRLLGATSARVRLAAYTRAGELVQQVVAPAADGYGAADPSGAAAVARAWDLVRSVAANDRATPEMMAASMGALRACGDYLPPDAGADIEAAIEEIDGLPPVWVEGPDEATRARAACAIAERLLTTTQVADLVGLTWS